MNKKPGVRLGAIKPLASLLCDLRPDVVHSHGVGALFYAGPACRRARPPVFVHTEHGQMWGPRHVRWIGRLAALRLDRFFCVSQDIATTIGQYGIMPRHKIAVVRNGINTARFSARLDGAPLRQSLGIPPGARIIGVVGRIDDNKRQDLLIESFAQVRDRMPDAHLLIVGDGPSLPKLRDMARALHVEPSVHFAGYQTCPEAYLQLMDVFALTSRSEGMPLCILEAWAAGVPVVAFGVDGVPEMVENGRTGLLLEFGDVAGLTAALSRILESPDLSQSLTKAGYDEVLNRFDVRVMAMNYQAQYQPLLERRAIPV